MNTKTITPADIDTFNETILALEEAFAEYGKITGIEGASGYSFKSIDSTSIEFDREEYWRYGGYEHLYQSMPIAFLFDRENWQADYDAKQAIKAQQELEKKQIKDSETAVKEREKLEKLAAKHNLTLVAATSGGEES